MQLLSAHELSLSFVTREVFSGVGFSLQSGAHVGLVGPNGCGKTTLVRLIMGELQPDEGSLTFSREAQIAYMEQFLYAQEGETLEQAVLHVFQPLIDLEQRLEMVDQRLQTGDTSTNLLLEQQSLLDEYEQSGGYTYRSRLRSTLLGLGFSPAELEQDTSTLSGGQRSKAALAKVLLKPANILILDEPTNHLDITSIEWLESYLSTLPTAFIIISHDRYFLDRATNQTWAFINGGLKTYNGNYSEYLRQRQGQDEIAAHHYENQLREIHRIEGIIEQQRRFNQARNFITIASKEKQIARLKKDLVEPEKKERQLRFTFNVPPPGGNDVLEIRDVAKNFGEKKLFSQVSMYMNRGERVFLLGPNGCGKTTLMKIILDQLPPDRGMARLGVNVLPAYYDQIHDKLVGEQSVLAHFTDEYPKLTQTQIRTMLGSFLFSGDEVEKPLGTLSGGEKARLTLMKLLLLPANLLLLDEPSNHLDIARMEAVEQALMAYPGTMLIISHDRYLVNKLADRIYYFSPNGLIESLGNYDDFLEKQTMQEQASNNAAIKPLSSGGGDEYRRRKEELAARRREEKRLLKAEADIVRLEDEIKALEQTMAEPETAADYQQLMELQDKKETLEQSLLAALDELVQAETALTMLN